MFLLLYVLLLVVVRVPLFFLELVVGQTGQYRRLETHLTKTRRDWLLQLRGVLLRCAVL